MLLKRPNIMAVIFALTIISLAVIFKVDDVSVIDKVLTAVVIGLVSVAGGIFDLEKLIASAIQKANADPPQDPDTD